MPTSVLGEQQLPAVAVSKAKAVAPKATLRSVGKLPKPEELAQVQLQPRSRAKSVRSWSALQR